ncbi:hypothetical protein UFOVP152_10 [uncultured Caudovirales phage]|uniref:Uncharacterized protein n=1 Tax=uncultured Caudovirales phage TaxID=2100421 RepID=A0A6J7WBJ0_9CAUD|nr:hypothetical protein UFOVP152_10 [uncultured Caudovirales phage]
MFNLSSGARASLALSIAGGISGTIGSYYSALGDKRALQLQAEMADRNALHAATAGTEQASNVLQRGAQLMSTQRANMAANGVDLTEGSPAAVIESTDTMRQVDANTTINNAMQEAFGYRAEATMKRGAADAISPAMQAGTTLLDSASKVASQWATMKKLGLLDKPKVAKMVAG